MNWQRTTFVQQTPNPRPSVSRPLALPENTPPITTSQQTILSSNISHIYLKNNSTKGLQIKIVQGFLVLCEFCGFYGNNDVKCERCKRVFIRAPKRIHYKRINHKKEMNLEQLWRDIQQRQNAPGASGSRTPVSMGSRDQKDNDDRVKRSCHFENP